MKKISHISLGKGLFLLTKENLSLTKVKLANPGGKADTKSPLSEIILILMIQIKKNQKAHSLTKCPISERFIFLKQALIDKRFSIPVCFIISNSNSNQFDFSYLTK